MTMKLAYAALAVTALAGSAALAHQANDTSQQPAPQQPAAQAAGQFVEKQTVNEWRAPKLIGVAVYGSDNQ